MGQKTGLEDCYVIRNQKKMRFGYTTGSCAAAACKGAVHMLLGGGTLEQVELMTPKGILLHLKLHDVQREQHAVSCAVKKDAGTIRIPQTESLCMPVRRGLGTVQKPMRMKRPPHVF